MSAEPQNIRAAFGRAAQPILRKRTVEDYRDDLRRMFGKVPSWAELAKTESKRMWAEAGHKHTWDAYAKAQTTGAMRPIAKPAVPKLTSNEARAAEAHAAVMGALISGMSSSDVARVAKMTKERALRTLRRLEAAGIVYRTDNRTTQCAHWWKERT